MKTVLPATLIALALIIGASMLAKNNSATPTPEQGAPIDNVHIVDGKQIVDISAKGGYQPNRSVAKAGIPTTIRFKTSGTFDCSSSVRIPSMNISKLLPSSGTTDIDIGTQVASTFTGSCGMGMYPFEVVFE